MAFSWLLNGGDPNHLLIRMILQVGTMEPSTSDDSVQEAQNSFGLPMEVLETQLQEFGRMPRQCLVTSIQQKTEKKMAAAAGFFEACCFCSGWC